MSSNPTRDFYNLNAAKWAAEKNNSFFHEEQFKKFLAYVNSGDSVLDIGCASGIHVPLFLGLGRELLYEGIDVSESFVSIASERYPQLNFSVADLMERETLPEKKFDAFWAAAVLMHVQLSQWPDMMENIESMMKSGAYGYVTIPDERFGEKDERHFTLLKSEEFKEILNTRDWKIIESGDKGTTSTNHWLWYIVQLP